MHSGSSRNGGGVLDAAWTFWSNFPFQWHLPKLPPSSLLQAICQTTRCHRNKTCQPPKRSIHRSASSVIWLPGGNVDCRGLLPLNPTAVEVLCPSVYAPTGWVTRPLTEPEMFHAFNIPPSAIPPKTSVAGPCWQQTPPSKILQRAYLQWATDSLVTFLVPPIVHTKKTPLSMYRATGAIDLDSSFVSAIKADGADIPVFLWDDRIWSRGAHSESRVSKFKAKWEGRSPLDALRKGLLRHWRDRVRRSLIRYLKAT